MAINPPSDIVLDVARSADPEGVAAATKRLESLATSGAVGPSSFQATLDRVSAPGQSIGAKVSIPATTSPPGLRGSASKASKGGKIETQFEATLLTPLINEMMPKSAPAVYGNGVAADSWKSMLADQIAQQIAKSGSLGIARRLFASHPVRGSTHSLGTAHNLSSAPNVAQANSQPLSMPLSSNHLGESARSRGPGSI